jgi:hypothetical protein
MEYSFDVDHAKRYGLEEAVMLHNFIFWIRHNRANRKNLHDAEILRDGVIVKEPRTWTYNSLEAFGELFPFWSVRQIRRILGSLIEQGVIVRGNHNTRAYDRTCWYALSDESLLGLNAPICQNGQMDLPKPADGSAGTDTPIPDSFLPDDRPKEREAAPSKAGAPSATSSLSSLLGRIKTEAKSRGAPLVVGKDFSAGIGELCAAGISEAELLAAFSACIEAAPERVTFFPRDFLKWRKVWREKAMKRGQSHKDGPDKEAQRKELVAERERILRQREDPQAGEEIAQALSRLPWKR